MRTLPTPATIEDNEDVKAAFHLAFFQGEDQAKAIIKGGLAHLAEIQYLNFIGPYWMSVIYGEGIKKACPNAHSLQTLLTQNCWI